MKKYFLFTTLAANQTEFFKAIAMDLKKQGYGAGVVCFHERSMDLLNGSGVDAFNIFEIIRKQVPFETNLNQQFQALVKKYHLPDTQMLFAHEASAFNLRSQAELQRKFIGYCEGMNLILKDVQGRSQGPVVVVQELGGFSSLLSAFYVAKAAGILHLFLEPAFFKGRCFSISNSWNALPITEMAEKTSSDVAAYFQNTISNKKIVIPDKDRAHYLGLFAKIFRLYNFRRWVEKFADRYFLGKEEEFRYIWNYTFRHLKMFWCKFALSSQYKAQVPADPFVYFPLHVPMDVALTLRSPHCLDQYHLIDLICRSLPFGMKLLIKEHPAMVGVLDLGRMKELLKNHENLEMLNPKINNYDVLGKSQLIVTVNSKSGAEALALGQKVLVLGDAFYSRSPLVRYSTDLGKLGEMIAEELKKPVPASESIMRYFEKVWQASFQGEIYALTPPNIQSFSRNIIEFSEKTV